MDRLRLSAQFAVHRFSGRWRHYVQDGIGKRGTGSVHRHEVKTKQSRADREWVGVSRVCRPHCDTCHLFEQSFRRWHCLLVRWSTVSHFLLHQAD
ncbi:hypothetical protein KC366_g70 [Hortaea werneckii]|nr:hypothetical protein KC366_g70 [Hortaea werneckii]